MVVGQSYCVCFDFGYHFALFHTLIKGKPYSSTPLDAIDKIDMSR